MCRVVTQSYLVNPVVHAIYPLPVSILKLGTVLLTDSLQPCASYPPAVSLGRHFRVLSSVDAFRPPEVDFPAVFAKTLTSCVEFMRPGARQRLALQNLCGSVS